ncbi:MAG: AbrB/MazE/SpoVT family DNA-binding domain-containing protein [Pseudomonadota bacterium]
MSIVTVSSKCQIVIPRALREALGIQPGDRLEAIPYHGHIALVPVRPMKSMRGFLRGIDTEVERDDDRT